jgi:hypothetical protein
MLKYYEPNGPYIAQNSANYPTLMNVELAMRSVIQAGINRCARTQSHTLVATGLWPNCVVSKTGCLLSGPGLNSDGSGKSGELPHSQHLATGETWWFLRLCYPITLGVARKPTTMTRYSRRGN